jgi:hypothetical protein
MPGFRPLSKRGEPDPRFDGPQKGLPDYLLRPVMNWLGALLWLTDPMYGSEPDVDALQKLQLTLRLRQPLNWENHGESAIENLRSRMADDREFALDVLDFFVQKVAVPLYSDELGAILEEGGSEWEVAELPEDGRHLAKRVVGPVSEAIDSLRNDSERAHHHLLIAWQKLVGRSPDPSGAYREAIRGVEAAAKPVVTPDDPTATLGKIIRAVRDKPEKWVVVLDKSSPAQIADMTDLIWKGQLDRHGTDDPDAPLNVTQEEADAAVHIAISLSRLFASGAIRRA